MTLPHARPALEPTDPMRPMPAPAIVAPPAVAPQDAALLDHLRQAAAAARCKAHADLFVACASLSLDRDLAMQAGSEVLMRCLTQALGKRPVFYRVGEAELSFDEAWILRLARSLQQDESLSAAFLLQSRVPAHARRNLAFLVRAVTDDFCRN